MYQGSGWHRNFNKAVLEANKLDKPIYVEVGAKWCNYCKELNRNIYPQEVVKKLLDKFVIVKVDSDDDREFYELYEVNSVPGLLIFDKKKNLLLINRGFLKEKDLIKFLKNGLSLINLEAVLKNKVRKNDIESLYYLGLLYYISKKFNESNYYFKRYLKNGKEDKFLTDSHKKMADNYLKLKMYGVSLQYWKTFTNMKGSSDEKIPPLISYKMGICLFHLQKYKLARKRLKFAFNKLKRKHINQKIHSLNMLEKIGRLKQ
jgi:thiol-disulfide isomerase/thioredoxin